VSIAADTKLKELEKRLSDLEERVNRMEKKEIPALERKSTLHLPDKDKPWKPENSAR
jgi:hypothetical protein